MHRTASLLTTLLAAMALLLTSTVTAEAQSATTAQSVLTSMQTTAPAVSRLAVAYRGHVVTGTVRGAGCAARRVVLLQVATKKGWRTRGSDQSNRRGRYRIKTVPLAGRLRTVVRPRGGCPRQVSKTVRIKAPSLTLNESAGSVRGRLRGGPAVCRAGRTVAVLRNGVREAQVTTDARGRFSTPAATSGGRIVATVRSTRRCLGATSKPLTLSPAPDPAPEPVLTRIEIVGGGVLLNGTGDQRDLVVRGFNERDLPTPVVPQDVTWTVGDPAVVSIDSAGTASAGAPGSTSIVASVDDVRSPEALAVVVSTPEPAQWLTDDDIVSGPEPVVPDDEPVDFDTALVVTLAPATPRPDVGSLLLSTGGVAVAGRVSSTEAQPDGSTVVTLQQVGLREALGADFDVDGTFDLAGGEIGLPEGADEFFTTSRQGDTITFTPRPDAARRANLERTDPERTNGCSRKDPTVPNSAVECTFLNVISCEITGTGITNTPIRLAAPPAFTLSFSPQLDTTEQDDESFRFVVKVHPKVTFTQELKLEATVELKAECKITLGTPKIPAPGALGFFLSAVLPVGVGFEVNPKLTVADLGFGAKAELGLTAELGLICEEDPDTEDETCDIVNEAEFDKPVFEPSLNAPNLAEDARLKATLQGFAFMDFKIGPPAVEELQLEIGGLKLGPKAEADLATRQGQISAADYASTIKADLSLDLSIGAKLGALARLLGMSEVKAIDQPLLEAKLDVTPTGTLVGQTSEDNPDLDDEDPSTMDIGDTVRFEATVANRADFDPFNPGGLFDSFADPTSFLGVFDISRVMLVNSSGEVIATTPGVDGQTDYAFDLQVVATGEDSNGNGAIRFGKFTDVYLFIETEVPLDILGLELARAGTLAEVEEALFYLQDLPTPEGPLETRLMTMEPDGQNQREVVLPGISGGLSNVAFTADGRYVAAIHSPDDETRSLTVVDRLLGTSRRLTAPVCGLLTVGGTTAVGAAGLIVDDACKVVVFPLQTPPQPDDEGVVDCASVALPVGSGPECLFTYPGARPTPFELDLGVVLTTSGRDFITPSGQPFPESNDLVGARVTTGDETVLVDSESTDICQGPECTTLSESSFSGSVAVYSALALEDAALHLFQNVARRSSLDGNGNSRGSVTQQLSLMIVDSGGSSRQVPGIFFSCSEAVDVNSSAEQRAAFARCRSADDFERNWSYVMSPDDSQVIAYGRNQDGNSPDDVLVTTVAPGSFKDDFFRGLFIGDTIVTIPGLRDLQWVGTP